MRIEVMVCFLVVLTFLALALVSADTAVSIENAAPQIIPGNITVSGDVSIKDFSYDPNNDPYTCSFCMYVDNSSFCANTCSINYPFSSGNYTLNITLDDGLNSSQTIIVITYEIKKESGTSKGGGTPAYIPIPGKKEDIEDEEEPQKETPLISIKEFISDIVRDKPKDEEVCDQKCFMTEKEFYFLIIILLIILFIYYKLHLFDRKLDKKIKHLKKSSDDLKKHRLGHYHYLHKLPKRKK